MPSIDAAALRRYLRTQPGEIYDADAVSKSVDAVTMGLAQNGKPFATVLPRSERLPERGLINLVYTVDDGKRLYVERIDIHGNTRTRDDVIRREFDFGEGDAYNRALIDRAERRLKALGYFKSVKITAQPGSAPDRVVLDVDGRGAARPELLRSCGGYSSADGPVATISVGDRNFLGTGDIAKASVTYGEYARGLRSFLHRPLRARRRGCRSASICSARRHSPAPINPINSTFYGAKVSVGTPLNDKLGMQLELRDLQSGS